MARELPQCVDTVIIGNGPSALILSYILHGWTPYYIGGHHDSILDSKLQERQCLLDLTPDLYAHFQASWTYSTQALPVNTLLDTLLRPNADTEINPTSCIEWRFEPGRAVAHVAIGQTPKPGGQWAENPLQDASSDIGTLSYAEQLSLPGYTYSDHVKRRQKKEENGEQCDFVRPSRTEVADYLEAYPAAVGISDAIFTATEVSDVRRTNEGFEIGNLGIMCKHLVLASGIFTVNIPPPEPLAPVATISNEQEPLLVIGSGFSAADIIISAPVTRKIIHIFQWAPESRPSPLRGCHHTAYPEYATVYRQMKLSTINSSKSKSHSSRSPMLRRKSNPFFSQRDWSSLYEGLPNAEITSVDTCNETNSATITIKTSSGETITRKIGGLDYVVGRRGSLAYLTTPLRSEVLSNQPTNATTISGRSLRSKAESSLEVAPNVFIIGSLAGDSLIRHAVGGCVYAAGRIVERIPTSLTSNTTTTTVAASTASSHAGVSAPPSEIDTSCTTTTAPCSCQLSDTDQNEDTDLDRQGSKDSTSPTAETTINSECLDKNGSPKSERNIIANGGHDDLHLDRRNLARAVEVANARNRFWAETGWWAGAGVGVGGWKS